jgi:hypothetical protein
MQGAPAAGVAVANDVEEIGLEKENESDVNER